MNKIKELLDSKNVKIKRMEEILEMETATEESLKEYDELEVEVKSISSKIEKLNFLEKEKTQKAFENFKSSEKVQSETTKEFTEEPPRVEWGEPKKEKNFLGKFIRAKVGAQSMGINPGDYANKVYGERSSVTKALLTAGSGAVPTPVFDEIFDLLRNELIISRMGIETIVLENGRMDLSEETSATGSSFVGEAAVVDAVDPVLAQKQLLSKKIVTITTISNEMLNFNASNVEGFIQRDLVNSTVELMDAALLRGTLSATNPNSIQGLTPVGNTQAATGTGALADVDADLQFTLSTLQGNNSRLRMPYWIMSPRTYNHLRFLRTSTGAGELAYRGIEDGMLKGIPIIQTAAVPITLSGTLSELYLVDASEYLCGVARNLRFDVSDSASVQYSGSLVSSFHNDSRAYRMIHEVDIQSRQPTAAGAYVSAIPY